MAKTLIGNVKGPKGDKGVSLVNKGRWQANVEYKNDEVQIDVVMHNGSTYACLQSHTSTDFIDPSNNGYWICLAEKGEKGEVGDTGPTGPQGPTEIKVDNLTQKTLSLKTERNSQADKVNVQIIDTNGNAVMVETTASQVYTQEGLTLESLLNNAIFVLEDADGITHCGDYERYVKFVNEGY